MARSQRTSNPVTLFPFLAVLLCTIGALVLMLVVVSAGIRKDAVETARQKSIVQSAGKLPEQSEPPLPMVEAVSESPVENATVTSAAVKDQAERRERMPIEPIFAQEPPPSPITVAPPRTLAEIADLEKAARRLASEVAARAKRLQSVNVKTYALRKQLRTVKAQQDDLQLAIIRTANQRAKLDESTGELRVENQQVIEWLDESRKLINEHKDQLVSPVHSIVPYDGQTGTVRRPIIIECVGEVVRFEAEQVEIPIEVLQKFSPEQNPLASGVEALFRYWMAKEQVADPRRQPRKPYALILVSPSGAEAFSTAVFALDQMVGDFGYELVETDFLYEVPETTADAVRECRAAVEAEIRRGPIRSRRVLNSQGPIDIARVARGPAASRGFFSSSDFRNRKAGGTNSDEENGDGTPGGGSVAEGTERDVGESVAAAAAAARREAEMKSATERARQLLSGRSAEAANLLSKGTPANFDEARAAILAEAARVEAELRQSREAAGQSGLSDAFRNEIAARNAAAGQSENQFTGQPGNEPSSPSGSSAGAEPDGDAASNAVGGVGQVGDSSADRRASSVRNGGGESRRGPGAGDSSQPTGDSSAAIDVSIEGRASQGQPGGERNTSSGQEISSLLNRPAGASAGNASSTSSSGGDSSEISANGPAIPTRPQANRTPSRKTQRRWGRSHPDASLGLEKVVELRIESSRVVVGDQFQVTRTPERSKGEIVKLTIQTIEHLANQWGFPPPRFYWVPSVRLVFDAEESQLGKMLDEAIEDAGAALE